MHLYLDTCVLKRPFDRLDQPGVRLEAEAFLKLLAEIGAGNHSWTTSTVVVHENAANPVEDRRKAAAAYLTRASQTISLTPSIQTRASRLHRAGLGALDALHLACAEQARVDAFVTVDDQILRFARRGSVRLRVKVSNPLDIVQTNGGPAHA